MSRFYRRASWIEIWKLAFILHLLRCIWKISENLHNAFWKPWALLNVLNYVQIAQKRKIFIYRLKLEKCNQNMVGLKLSIFVVIRKDTSSLSSSEVVWHLKNTLFIGRLTEVWAEIRPKKYYITIFNTLKSVFILLI